MDTETLIKIFGILAIFIGLILSAAKHRRDAREEQRKIVLNDIKVLKKLKRDTFLYKRVNSRLNKSILREYPPHEVFYFWAGILGLLLFIVFGFWGALLMLQNNWWAVGAFLVSIIGFDLQKRSLIPGFEEKPPGVELSDDE